ncbi:hypothetical protein LCGC14_2070820, partial [marine sediment metagenome]
MCPTKKSMYSDYLASRTKRLFDIIVCLLILPPAIVVISLLSIVIFIRDGRPIFFIQERVGKKGTLFRMPKLRSMITHSNSDNSLKTEKEITSTGNFLRKHRLD